MAKNKAQGAVLATMVCLALTSGTALAATPSSTGERLLDTAEQNARVQAKAVPPLRWNAALQGQQAKAQPVIITAKDVEAQKKQVAAATKSVAAVPPNPAAQAPSAPAASTPAAASTAQQAAPKTKVIPFQPLFRDPVERPAQAQQKAGAASEQATKPQKAAPKAAVSPKVIAKPVQPKAAAPQVMPKKAQMPQAQEKTVSTPTDRRPAAFREVSDSAWRHIQAGIFATVEQFRSAGPQNLEPAALRLVQLLNENDKLTRMEKVEYLVGIGYAINHSNLRPYQKSTLIKLISMNFA